MAKAKAKARAQKKVRDRGKASRFRLRREAVQTLNQLAADIALGTRPLPTKSARGREVERLIRALEPRCQEAELLARLRGAATLWQENGGHLERALVPEGTDTPAQVNGQDEHAGAAGVPEAAVVARHRVLEGGYILKSKAFLLTYNSRRWTRDSWDGFRAWAVGLQATLGFAAWAVCMEITCNPTQATFQEIYHFHAYFYWSDGVGLYRRNTDDLVFEGVRPRVDTCSATGVGFRMAACHGLWYVAVVKHGTLHSETSYKPWRDYTPRDKWLTDLWAAHKMTHAEYLAQSILFRNGHASRARDIHEVRAAERREAVTAHLARERALIQTDCPLRPRKSFQEITTFVGAFRVAALRRPILAIIGGTNTGKSHLGGRVLQEVATTVGVPGFLELTVQSDEHLDMSEFDVREHGGILLDGVGDALFLHRHREILQGRDKEAKEGKSATMIYAYPFTLCRRGVVATFDLSAKNLELFRTHHWLRDARNVIQLRLTGPAWHDPAAAPPVVPRDPRAEMRTWAASDVSSYLESCDLHGPARILLANGVRGQDLVGMTAEELTHDVGVSRFAGRRVADAKDAFLRG